MKRLKIATLIGIFCLYGSIFGQEKSFTLNGKIIGDAPDYIMLFYQKNIDSAKVENNRFQFTGRLENEFEKISFEIHPSSRMTFDGVYLENETMFMELEVKLEKQKPYNSYAIRVSGMQGGKTVKLFTEFSKFMEENNSKYNFSELFHAKMKELITEYPNHPVFLVFLKNFLNSGKLKKEEVQSLLNLMDTSKMQGWDLENLKKSLNP